MIKRIEQLCSEFDERVSRVGVGMARAEFAKRLAELEGRPYQKNEFCEDIECYSFAFGACQNAECTHTAKEFHKWLKANGFGIIKAADGGEGE